jgi:hypothetical protein
MVSKNIFLSLSPTKVGFFLLKKQELLTVREHLGSPLVYGEIHDAILFSFLCCIFFCLFAWVFFSVCSVYCVLFFLFSLDCPYVIVPSLLSDVRSMGCTLTTYATIKTSVQYLVYYAIHIHDL